MAGPCVMLERDEQHPVADLGQEAGATVTGALTGTMEIWLEPSFDGVILHYFVHAEPSGVAAWQLAKMNLAKMNHKRRVAGKNMAFEVKRTLEAARPVGTSRLAR